MRRRSYRKPPVTEAICELRFAPATPWDPTVPTRIWERLRSEYDGTPVAQPLMHINLAAATGAQAIVGEPRTQFPNAAGSRLLSIGHQTVAIHFMRDYPGWEIFGPSIERARTAVSEVVPDIATARIGIRFVNRVEIPTTTSIELTDYFPAAGRNIEGLPNVWQAFLERHEYVVEAPTMLLISTLASIAPMAHSQVAVLLDIDAIYQAAGSSFLQPGDVAAVIERLRQIRTDAFEASISDRLREIFDAQ